MSSGGFCGFWFVCGGIIIVVVVVITVVIA